MREALDVPEAHRQHRLRSLQGLDLALLIDAEDDGVLRGIEVEPHDVADLFDEERIGGELEVPGAMRLDAEQPEVALDGALADAGLRRHGAHGPVRGLLGPGPEGDAQQASDLFVIMGSRSSRPRDIVEPREPLVAKAAAPLTHEGEADADGCRDAAMGFAAGRAQHDLGAPHQPGGQRRGAHNAFELLALGGTQLQRKGGGTSTRHGDAPGRDAPNMYHVLMGHQTRIQS